MPPAAILALGLATPIMMATAGTLAPLELLAIHVPEDLHLAGVGQLSHGLNVFLVAIIYFPFFLATPPLDIILVALFVAVRLPLTGIPPLAILGPNDVGFACL